MNNSNSGLMKLTEGREENPAQAEKIESVFMTADQRYMFEVFVGLGSERSLPKLLDVLKAEGLPMHMQTLKRYSARFKWYELAERTEAKIVEGVASNALPAHTARLNKTLEYIEKLKDSFYKRVDDGEIIVDIPEFVTLLKTEALLRGDPTERREDVHVTKLEGEIKLNDVQLAAVLRLGAAQEFGLPPPDAIEGEVVDANH